jgi:flagellar biosynthetic protein FliP
LFLWFGSEAWAQDAAEVALDMADEVRDMPVSSTVRLLVILTGLTFIPAIILAMTPFTRFIIVFTMLRQAMGLQRSPPNQVILGLALFISMLIMQPVLNEVNDNALQPFLAGDLETMDALNIGMQPMRTFMLSNTRRDDLTAIMSIGKIPLPESLDDLPTTVIISSFMLSELKTAFVIGVKIYLPFLVIDMVVANILLGMGMMVLPPVVISIPFKLLLFVLMDGWTLLITSMAKGFHGV